MEVPSAKCQSWLAPLDCAIRPREYFEILFCLPADVSRRIFPRVSQEVIAI